jgi:hypothetical protein
MSPLNRWSRFGFNLVAWLFVGCVVVQFYLAGMGVFESNSHFITHRDFGYLFGVLTLVLVVLALLGRFPRWLIMATIGLLLLFALQSIFLILGDSLPAVAALHAVNGVLILGVAAALAWTTRGSLRATADETALDPR